MPDLSIDVPEQRGSRRRRFAIIGLGILIGLFVFWVVADQDIIAGASSWDDLWFIEKGRCTYWFDRGYSYVFSFLKEPVYPLFVAFSFRLGIPLRLTHEALYVSAAAFLAWCLVYRRTRPWVGLAVFTVIALYPVHVDILNRALHDSVYSSLLLFTFGTFLLQLKLPDHSSRWFVWLGGGIALGLLWNTRAERLLLLLPLAVILAAGLVTEQRRHRNVRAAVQGWLKQWLPTFTIAATVTLGLMVCNYSRWGVFAVSEMNGAPNYTAACAELIKIKPDNPVRFAPVTYEARQRAYAASPTFRQLAPFLEGRMLKRWRPGWSPLQDVPPNEYSGSWFVLAMRDAVAAAGYSESARDAEAFYGNVATELRAAAETGLYETRWLPPGVGWAVNPDVQTYARFLPESWRKVWYVCWHEGGDAASFQDGDVPPEIRTLFDRVACRRLGKHLDVYEIVSTDSGTPITQVLNSPLDVFNRQRGPVATGDTTRVRVRKWLGSIYGHGREIALVAGFFVAGLVLLTKRTGPHWGAYILPALVFGAYGFTRLALMTLLDASLFPAATVRYLFPASLSLLIVAVWLLAEGIRLLAKAAVTRPVQFDATDTHPVEASESRIARPLVHVRLRRLRRLTGYAFLLATIVLACQWGYGYHHPPDTVAHGLNLDRVDNEIIRGWARLPDDPHQSVDVEIWDGDTSLGRLQANEFRQDLFDLRIGTGHHSFTMQTPEGLLDGKPHQIRVTLLGTNYETVTREVTLKPRRNIEKLRGVFDSVDDNEISGWAYDSDRPKETLKVDIYDGLELIATVAADRHREDLAEQKIGDGRHGFNLPTPRSLKDGSEHSIRVLISGTEQHVRGSPKPYKSSQP